MSLRHKEALRLFTDVSKRYPASVTAQSAALALETKRNRRVPMLLQNMHNDEDAIEIIAKTAEIAHKQSENTSAPAFVNRDITRAILHSEITWIKRMTRLRRANLIEILQLYGQFPDEKTYDLYVEEHYFPTP